ncbi:MAG: glycosyltransferase family 2 protein [Candidatus Omnitrophota bacterium]
MKSSKSSPLFSIITVVFNGETHLEQTIQSVIHQSCTDFEYIVIDGGSTDGTLNIIRAYDHAITSWISEPDRGIFDAMNKGIRKSSGSFLAFLNADDWYEPHILEKVKEKISSITESLENRVIYCDYYSYDEELSSETRTEQISELKYWKGMTVSHQAMFVHRSVIETLGMFSTDYRFASDYDYFLRMITAGVVFTKVDVHGVNFRKGGVSTQYMNRSIGEVSKIVRLYFGIWSREYVLFLLTNRCPSMIANIRFFLSKIIGKNNTLILRRLYHKK